jgi:peptide/nickel transport system permease protein
MSATKQPQVSSSAPVDEGNKADAAASREDLTYGDIVWSQFVQNRMAVVSLWVIVGLVLIAVIAPVIASDHPFLWNEGAGATSPWVYSLFDRNVYISPVDIFFNLVLVVSLPLGVGLWLWVKGLRATGLSKRARRRKIRTVFLVASGLVVAVFVLLLSSQSSSEYRNYTRELEKAHETAAAGEDVTIPEAIFTLIPYSPRSQGFGSVEKPSETHWIGTDQGTRDVGVRLIFGTRVALTVGVIAVAIYVFIGIVLGATAGFFGGRVDLVIQRMIEIMMSVPSFFVILTVVAFVDKPTIFHIMVILGLIRWTGVARLVRGEFLKLRKQEFVTAAQALGYRRRRIIFEQILPNALGPVLVAAAFGVASCILIEATLSFLGLGDLTVPSWGQTIKEGYATGAWHLILAPGFCIFLTVSALNLVGEGLRDALDPKLRQ